MSMSAALRRNRRLKKPALMPVMSRRRSGTSTAPRKIITRRTSRSLSSCSVACCHGLQRCALRSMPSSFECFARNGEMEKVVAQLLDLVVPALALPKAKQMCGGCVTKIHFLIGK